MCCRSSMYAPTPEKSSARHTKIGWAPRGDLTSLVQGRWRQADDFYGELAARGKRRRRWVTCPSPRAGSDAVASSSPALRPNEEEPRDARHPPRRHRVRPSPEVCFSLAGLDHLCLPAVLGNSASGSLVPKRPMAPRREKVHSNGPITGDVRR